MPDFMWCPDASVIDAANITYFRRQTGQASFESLYEWSISDPGGFWEAVVATLGITFRKPAEQSLDLSEGAEHPCWLPGAEFNIVESCFQADPTADAVVFATPEGSLGRITYDGLRDLVRQVSRSITAAGFVPGDRLAIVMPMTVESVAIYLGIIHAGCVAVSVADSFAPAEITRRLSLGGADGVFSASSYLRMGKTIDVYSRVCEGEAAQTIVLPGPSAVSPLNLRGGDVLWKEFLSGAEAAPGREPIWGSARQMINILFSSGTTGDPKAIPWNQTAPIKAAADGFFHQDIHPGDVVVWPTNLGWMMGPWLIFASLINRATIGLYDDSPATSGFGHFVQDAKVTMLGVVPTLVRGWRASQCMECFDWSSVRSFSSTGEASHPDDMQYLSRLAGGKPVIEYCGGTEIGGGYISSSVVQPNVAAAFSTPALGSRFVILDEQGNESHEGQLYLVPPTMGMSVELLHGDHHATYFEGAPSGPGGEILRRHGDYFRRLPGGFYVAGGRVDDTMNLGGIKVSSAEIEQVLNRRPEVTETAAVAFRVAAGGPDRLMVFLVPSAEAGKTDEMVLLDRFNQSLKSDLNPLFRIDQIRVVDSLPRTASNKVMRRKLRADFEAQHPSGSG